MLQLASDLIDSDDKAFYDSNLFTLENAPSSLPLIKLAVSRIVSETWTLFLDLIVRITSIRKTGSEDFVRRTAPDSS